MASLPFLSSLDISDFRPSLLCSIIGALNSFIDGFVKYLRRKQLANCNAKL
jgi:hypothetical protein